MAGTRRKYFWRIRFADDVEATAAYPAYRDQLARLPRREWFRRAELVHEGPELLVSVSVFGRDRWAVNRRQRVVVRSLVAACPASLDAGFSQPEVFPPVPHTNRGRAVAWRGGGGAPEEQQRGGEDRLVPAVKPYGLRQRQRGTDDGEPRRHAREERVPDGGVHALHVRVKKA